MVNTGRTTNLANVQVADSKHAVYAVNRYALQLLDQLLGWNASKYGGRQPMTASNTEPELAEYGLPYIVYGYANQPSSLVHTQQVAYSIFSQDTSDINNAIRMLDDAFDRADVTAFEVNEHKGAGYEKYSFKSFRVVTGTGPDEEEEKGGKHMGFIVIEYTYTYKSGFLKI